MMSWRTPSLEHPPAPETPRFMLWIFIILVVGITGLGIGVYLSANEMLPDTMNNIMIILVFAVLPALLIPSIRFFIYSLDVYRHQLFTDMLDDSHREWRSWAGKHLGLLAHSRLTQIDEENDDDNKGELILSLLSPNKDNVLTLNLLNLLPSWEKKEKAIRALLTPVAEYYHQHTLTQPITFYWQAAQSDTDLTALIREEATRLSLSIESIEPLAHATLAEWLSALYEEPFDLKLYAILSYQSDDTGLSEEASCLLLSPQELYERLHIPAKIKLLRPLSTDINDFHQALKIQCEFQLAGAQLNSVWHCGVTDNNKKKCIESYYIQGITCISEQLYDADTFLGKGGRARHAAILSLAGEYPKNQLVVYQNQETLLLQQILS